MKNVFLTGASTGIGLETARLLTKNGFEVWGTSRALSRLPKLKKFHPVELDLAAPKTIEDIFNFALKEAKRFDILINNAGYGHFGPAEDLSLEIWRAQLQTLLLGPLQLIQLTLPHMRQQGGGLIINVSSLASRFPIPFMAPYNSAKAALSSLTQTLRLELGNHPNIHIVDLQPGDIRTPFHESMKSLNISAVSAYSNAIKNAAKTIKENMDQAPPPQTVAKEILRIICNPSLGIVYKTGGFFQTIMAPLGARLAPPTLRERALRLFYRLDRKKN